MSRQPQIFAHRGAKSVAPENTLPAFAVALEMGVDGIELDVHRSKDGRLVVIHDFSVDKTTSGAGPVAEYTAAQLAALDAGSHFDTRFAGTGVPTLEQVFDLVGDRCRINVEIKSEDLEGGPEADLLIALIRDQDLYSRVLISSFNPITLIKLRWLDPQVDLALLHGPLPPFLLDAWTGPVIAPVAVHPHHSLVDAGYMAWARSRGCVVNTWTVNDPAEAQRLADLGVNAIMSDVPDQIRAHLAA